MGASGDGHHKDVAKLCISRADTGGTIVLLEVVPDLLDCCKVSNSSLNQRRDMQGDVTKCLLIVLIPRVILVCRVRSRV